jgi:endogenous inhibitor of DNA gyrase (YacG/DUF329 family)
MSGMSERAEAPRSKSPGSKPCPICGKPAVPEFHPFCTRRCANVYVVPVKDDEDEDEDGARKGEGES